MLDVPGVLTSVPGLFLKEQMPDFTQPLGMAQVQV